VVVDDSPSNLRAIPIEDGKYTVISAPVVGGKGMYVAEFARQVGAVPAFCHYQVGWTALLGDLPDVAASDPAPPPNSVPPPPPDQNR
jgi:hypothetical protein